MKKNKCTNKSLCEWKMTSEDLVMDVWFMSCCPSFPTLDFSFVFKDTLKGIRWRGGRSLSPIISCLCSFDSDLFSVLVFKYVLMRWFSYSPNQTGQWQVWGTGSFPVIGWDLSPAPITQTQWIHLSSLYHSLSIMNYVLQLPNCSHDASVEVLWEVFCRPEFMTSIHNVRS